MVTNIGIQILIIAAIGMAFLLVCYTGYVRVRQSTFTEKRFNFVALWSCSMVVFLAVHAVVNIPIIEAVLSKAGLDISPPDIPSKMLVTLIAVVYVLTIAYWSRSWNGLLSEKGHRAREQGAPKFFVIDGAKETWRIIRRDPPSPVYRGRSFQAPQLPPPMSELTFHEQVRELLVGRWPEIVIDDSAWIADGSCWLGQDTGLDQPILVVCGLDETEINIDRLAAVVKRRNKVGTGVRLIAVFTQFKDKANFVDALTRLSTVSLEVYTFEELILAAVPLARYKHEIERLFREERLPGADFAIADVFVPARAYETKQDGKRLEIKGEPIDLDSYVADWIIDGSPRHLALLGTYGQGKSSAALALTHRLLHDRSFAARCHNRIPILIRLTGLSPKSSDSEALLGQWGYRLGLNGRALLALHRAGRTILILDAFDELANVADRADRFDHFAALWQFASNGAKVLLTGRPNFFLDDEELKRALGISEGVAVGPYCHALRMAPFEPEQIAATLRWMPDRKVQSFMAAVGRLPQLLEIARRPSLLFQVSRLWHEKRIDIEGDDVYSGTVIRAFVTYSLERQIQKQRTEMASGRPDHQFIPLTLAELDYFTSGCAVAALSEGRSNSLPAPAFRATIARLLDAVPESGLPLSAVEGGALGMPLKERLADRPDPTEACVQAVRTHGVIEHDPTKPGMHKFSHKSFAEALGAEVLVYRVLNLQGVPSLVWNVLWPAALVSQKAIFLLSMDIAAANRHETEVRSGSAMLTRLLRRYSFFGRAVYDWTIAHLVISENLAKIIRRVMIRKSEPADGTQSSTEIYPVSEVAHRVSVQFKYGIITLVITAIAGAFTIGIMFVYLGPDTNKPAIFLSFMMMSAAVATFSTAVLPRIFALPLRMMVDFMEFCLAVEYALKKPPTGSDRQVLQFAVLDAMVERAVARASGAIRIASRKGVSTRGKRCP